MLQTKYIYSKVRKRTMKSDHYHSTLFHGDIIPYFILETAINLT